MSTPRHTPLHAAYIAAWADARRDSRDALIAAARCIGRCLAIGNGRPVCGECRNVFLTAADVLLSTYCATVASGVADDMPRTAGWHVWLLCRFSLTYRIETYKAVEAAGGADACDGVVSLPDDVHERLERLFADVVTVARRFASRETVGTGERQQQVSRAFARAMAATETTNVEARQ